MSAAAAGAAVSAGGIAAASEAFKYNRENYQYDEGGRRFARFTTGFNMTQAQVKQYREDLTDMTTFTVTKQDTYHTLGTIFFVLNFQLIMAGRLGVHGPSPPGWLLGLYWTNICSALMFLVTFTWMAMHASARATAGSAFLRTRAVRLPIPTPKQLDEARTTGNTFEKQRLAEMFRIPFVTPAPKEVYEETDPETGAKTKTPVSDRRIPKWYQTDEVNDLHVGGGATPGGNPEHFELYRGLQEEWWAFDVYSRIGVLFFMSHWLSSASLYSMCHVFTELRCIWPAWTVIFCFMFAHYGILQVDIVRPPSKDGMNIEMEKIVPFVPIFAVAGMTIDYSVLDASPFWVWLIYILSWCGYLIQFGWALRMYQLAMPQREPEAPEIPGQPWTPAEWPIPPAFKDAVYVVAAPKKVEQPCLLQELHAARGEQAKKLPQNKGRDSDPTLFGWKLFRGACITTISMWTLIMCGRVFEQINGERKLLKQESRVERWPSHMQPWMPPWSRYGTRNEYCHAGGCDRRLSEADEVPDLAQQLISAIGPMAEAFRARAQPEEIAVTRPNLDAEFAWPAELQPTVLTSSGNRMVGLSRSRRGAIQQLDFSSRDALAQELDSFVLAGIDALGDIIGATLADSGLIITTNSGAVAECPGVPSNGQWACNDMSVRLPTGGAPLTSAVTTRVAGSDRLRAAMAMEEGSLMLMDLHGDGIEWLPAGEVRMPTASMQVPHLSLSSTADELLVADGGKVLRWPLSGTHGVETMVAPAPAGSSIGFPHAACQLEGGRMAHVHGATSQVFVTASA